MPPENPTPEPTPQTPPANNPAPAQTPPAPAPAPDETKTRLQSIQQELASIKNEKTALEEKLSSLETSSLEKEKNYEKLYEKEKALRLKSDTRAKEVAQNYLDGLKESAIKEEALKLGIKENYLSFLDKNDSMVSIETTSTGKANVLGVKDYIQGFKEKHPDCFATAEPPNINTKTNPGSGKIPSVDNIKELLKLEKENPQQYFEAVKDRFAPIKKLV